MSPVVHPWREVTPLPKLQLFIILLVLFAEPITSTVIFPFINQEIIDLGITHDPRRVGYYVGLIESLFYFTEFTCTLHWGRLSDRIGRRPVVLMGLFGLGLSVTSFGLSKTLVQLIISRALAGALNGNVGVFKTMLGEISDETNFATLASFMPLVWSSGVAVGSFLGGTLSRPYERLPSIFGHSTLWRDYPYLLPCVAAACFPAVSFILCALFLKETAPAVVRKSIRDANPSGLMEHGQSQNEQLVLNEHTPLLSQLDDSKNPAPSSSPSNLRSLLIRPVIAAILNYGALSLIDIACIAILPLYFATPIEFGGLGLPTPQIGVILGIQGLLTGIFQIAFFPLAYRRFGGKIIYAISAAAYIPLTILWPVTNCVARTLGGTHWMVWVCVGLQQVCFYIGSSAYSCVLIYITASAPSREHLGATNGLAQMTASFSRTIGPYSATALFAFSIDRNVWGGNFVYCVMVLLGCGTVAVSSLLEDDYTRPTAEVKEGGTLSGD